MSPRPSPPARVTAENVERLARQFHETYERLAPSFGYETREESAVPWEEVPEQNRALMVAVVGEVTAALAAELEATKRELDEAREEVILANFDGHYARAEAAEQALSVAQDALREIRHLVRSRRTSLHMDGTEMFTQPILARINSILTAALAVPADTKEPT